MKRRAAIVHVTDHAVIRYLERGLGVDVAALKRHIASMAQDAAEMGAVGLKVDRIKLVISPDHTDETGTRHVHIPTVLERNMLGAIADANARQRRRGACGDE
ncbi:MAG: hypothetical protein NXH91_12005 [Phyllobacteriaceae bacterium]|nr:hypothetical protein [Phyllobacteriaceae bacterium]